jgi:hypothetical protein
VGTLLSKMRGMKSPGKGIISNDTEEKRNVLRKCGMPASIRGDMTCFGRAWCQNDAQGEGKNVKLNDRYMYDYGRKLCSDSASRAR